MHAEHRVTDQNGQPPGHRRGRHRGPLAVQLHPRAAQRPPAAAEERFFVGAPVDPDGGLGRPRSAGAPASRLPGGAAG